MTTRKVSSRLSALLICTLVQLIWSVPAFAQAALANTTDRGTWSSTDIYEVGAVVHYADANYISLTKNVGMAPDSHSTDWAIMRSPRSRPPGGAMVSAKMRGPADAGSASSTDAPNVTHTASYIAGRRYSVNDVVTEHGTSYIAVTDGARDDPANDVRFSVGNWAVLSAENPRWTMSPRSAAATAPDRTLRPAVPSAAEPKQYPGARDGFNQCHAAVQPGAPLYREDLVGNDCAVHSRTDYVFVGSLLLLSLFGKDSINITE